MRSSVLTACLLTLFTASACSSSGTGNSPPTEEIKVDSAVPETATDTSVAETDGDSSVDATVDAETGPRCGNGLLEGTEACDDGNNTDGDGCSATCENETSGPEDVCPGAEITLSGTGSAPRVGTVSGDTSSNKATYEHTCGGGSGRDAVYTFTPDVTGRAKITLDATFSAVLAMRTSCGDKATEVTCDSLTTASGKITKSFAVTAGAPVYIHVDGAGGSSGAFDLGVEISTAFCGNGVAELPEQCDDGNTTDGDGCSSTCALEAPGDGSVCPGIAYSFKGNPSVSFAGDTSTLTGSSTSTSACSSASAKNMIYAITPDKNGSLSIEMRAGFPNAMVHVRRECFSSSYEIDCTPQAESTAKPIPAGTPVKLTVPAVAGEALFVIADGQDSSASVGTFVLEATLNAAVCGNGIRDGGETCDDGNTVAGDGCDATCKVEPVTGDNCTNAQALVPVAGTDGTYAVKRSGSTAGLADDVNRCSGTGVRQPDAVYTVTAPIDGWMDVTLNRDAYLTLEVATACNLGTSTTGRVSCLSSAAGRLPEKYGMAVTAGTKYWLFVDADVNNNVSGVGAYLLDVKIRPQSCGNAVVEGTETCDDGNTINGDGCDSTCKLETSLAGDTCQTAITFPFTETSEGSGTFTGSVYAGTTNLSSKHSAAAPCGVTAGNDIWYKIVAPADGVLVAKVGDTIWDVSLVARVDTGCTVTTGSAFLTCSNVTPRGNEQISFPVTKGTVYSVIVDGTGKGGAFNLDITVAPSKCGDGVLSGGEACDDGNTTNGDGCSSTCTVETLSGLDTCPGFPVALSGTGSAIRSKTITVSTASLAADYTGSCAGGARDGVVAITPDVSGELRVQMSSNYLNVLYAREVCTDTTTQLSCQAPSTTTPAIGVREIVTTASAGVPVYFFVDGLSGESGTSQLKITLTP